MAKLSAYGRTQVFRVTVELDVTEALTDTDANPVVWRRREAAYMSDRTILVKHTVRWANGERHDWGWSVKGKLKRGITFADAHRIISESPLSDGKRRTITPLA